MTNVRSLDEFRNGKMPNTKDEMLAYLKGLHDRVEAGEIECFTVVAWPEEYADVEVALMGLIDFDVMELLGLFELMKFDILRTYGND